MILRDAVIQAARGGGAAALALVLAALVPAGHAAGAGTGENAAELLLQANQAYEAGDFKRALARYRRLVEENGAGAAVAYNLGNTHYRLEDRGRAILWYERARRLDPRDEDIRHNLKLARSALQDEPASAWEALDLALTPRELPAVTAFLAWLLFGVAGTALWLGIAWPRVRIAVCACALLLAAAGAWWALREQHAARPWAVILDPAVEVRSGPGTQYAVGFTAPAGRRALILNRRPGWVEIGLPAQSLKGWVKDGSIEKI